ncbi:MAG: hypothetical protein LBF27_16390 [Sphingobacterium sp.]|nr:hypothetical protein [Sphingobacterium sp.]
MIKKSRSVFANLLWVGKVSIDCVSVSAFGHSETLTSPQKTEAFKSGEFERSTIAAGVDILTPLTIYLIYPYCTSFSGGIQ